MRRMLGGLFHRLLPVFARGRENARILAYGHGQARSIRALRSVDGSGNPLPWYTYPAIEYLSQFDWRSASIFEFGAGYSSFFWAARAARVEAVESDPRWHAELSVNPVPRLTIHLRTEKEPYLSCLSEQGIGFDLIVIDGRWRRSCARLAPGHLSEGGIIVMDNTDWYPHTVRDLRAAGFWQVDFSGFGPVNGFTWTTSIFLGPDRRWQEKLADPVPVGGIRQHAVDD